MIDKVQKIREGVERLKSQLLRGACSSQIAMETMCKEEAYNEILAILDTIQEEPVSIWHDASEEPKPNMELICVGQYGNPLVLSSNSNSFKERYISKWAYFNDLLNLSNVQRAVKNWKEPVSEDFEKIVEEIAEPTILNAYGTKELARRLRNTMCGTSVSEDLGDYINELSKQFPEVSFAKLSRIAVRVAKWRKEHLWKPADGDDLKDET